MQNIDKLDVISFNKLNDDTIIYFLENNLEKLDYLLDYISLNLTSEKLPEIVTEKSFSFIKKMFNNAHFMKSKGFFNLVLTLEASEMDFSTIGKDERFQLINTILRSIKNYHISPACEVGRFIINHLLVSNEERLFFLRNQIFKVRNGDDISNQYFDMMHFALLSYLGSEEFKNLPQFEKDEIKQLFEEIYNA